jgi:hypothetical protein
VDGDVATVFAIVVYVVCAAWLSRYVALDVDARGKAGWAYGLMTLLVPPIGLAVWLLDRNRPPIREEWRPRTGGGGELIFFVLVIITFPWGLLIWLYLNRRASPGN